MMCIAYAVRLGLLWTLMVCLPTGVLADPGPGGADRRDPSDRGMDWEYGGFGSDDEYYDGTKDYKPNGGGCSSDPQHGNNSSGGYYRGGVWHTFGPDAGDVVAEDAGAVEVAEPGPESSQDYAGCSAAKGSGGHALGWASLSLLALGMLGWQARRRRELPRGNEA